MNFRFLPGIFLIAFIVFSCGTSKVVTTSAKTEAVSFEEAGNYQQATIKWEAYFKQTPIEETSAVDFANAAQSAYKSGNTKMSIAWFDQARYKNFSSFEMYFTLAEIYRGEKNISKELSALEYISDNYSERSDEINNRLFQIYYEIDLPDKAINVWKQLDESSKNDLSNLSSYFIINKAQNDTTVCDSVALILLEKEPKHIEALEWIATKFYWKGENRYQQEMAKYEANKTTRQYKMLLSELDKSTADFKKALSYFERLWKINPGEKYASYFANIYARFGDEKKAEYYKDFIK